MERLRIGARCERMWRECVTTNEQVAVDDATWRVQFEHQKLRQTPISERKGFLTTRRGRRHQNAVRSAMQLEQGIKDDAEPERYLHIPVKRPKGPRQDIISALAAESEGISRRMVERCWKEFRSIQIDR